MPEADRLRQQRWCVGCKHDPCTQMSKPKPKPVCCDQCGLCILCGGTLASSWSYKFDNSFENPEEFLTNRKTAVLVSLAAVLDHPLSIGGVDDLAANSIAMTDATSSVASDLVIELEATLTHPLSIGDVEDLVANSVAMIDGTSSVASDLEAELEAMLAHGRWHFATTGPVSPWCLSLCL